MTVFLGAATALGVMTVLSTYVGYAVTVIPRTFTQYISCALFAGFGLKMLSDGWKMAPDEGAEELEEVRSQLHFITYSDMPFSLIPLSIVLQINLSGDQRAEEER